MWQHTLIALLAFSTAFPTQVVQAAMTRERLIKIVDDILDKMKSYGPIIVTFIAPFVAKKLVEVGIIKIGQLVVSGIGKRGADTDEAEIQAAQNYLLHKFNTVIDNLKNEFHKRIDLQAVNGYVEDAQSTLADAAAAARDAVASFIREFADYVDLTDNFIIRNILRLLGSSNEKRSVIHSNLDNKALENYDKMLEELRKVLLEKFGKVQKRTVVHSNLDQDALNKYDAMLVELRKVLREKFGKVQKRTVVHTNLDQDALNKYDAMLVELRKVLLEKFGKVQKRTVVHTNLDQDALNKYDAMLVELRKVLLEKFGKVQKRTVIHTNLDQDALNNYDKMLQELREVLRKKFHIEA